MERARAAALPFLLGAAVHPEKLFQDETYTLIVQKEFQRLSSENAFKADCIRPHKTEFNFAPAELLLGFCQTHQKQFHAHTLVWHRALPQWMQAWEEISREDLAQHISTILDHFKGKIQSWDLVNEALDENGMLRDTVWKNKMGENYLQEVFETAAVIDPQALLFYNDFDLECNVVKRNALIEQIRRINATSKKVHGVGIQLHLDTGFSDFIQLKETLDLFAAEGLLIHLSELDISLPDDTIQSLEVQARLFRSILELYTQLPHKLQFGISMWGIRDQDSWLNMDSVPAHPLLFDRAGNPKPMQLVLKEFFVA